MHSTQGHPPGQMQEPDVTAIQHTQSYGAMYMQEPVRQAPLEPSYIQPQLTYPQAANSAPFGSPFSQHLQTQPHTHQQPLPQQLQTPSQPLAQPTPIQLSLQYQPQALSGFPSSVNHATTSPSQTRRGYFSFVRGRRNTAAAPPQPHATTLSSVPMAVMLPPGSHPQNASTESQHPTRDAQPVQEFIGGNWILIVFLPYFVATALQDTHLKAGLIIATIMSACILVLGFMTYALNFRKVFPHILEVLMLIIYVVQLGVSYDSNPSYEREVVRTYPFITHSALAGVCLLSMLLKYPVGYQTTQELVHMIYMTHTAVYRCGMYTTAVLTASLVTSCLLYLAPLCKGWDDRHFNGLNLIFRLIYPPLATALALLFVRFFPDIYLPNLAVVHGLNSKPQGRMSAYLTNMRHPPSILDAAMYQSTVDAATKSQEATSMRPAAKRALYGNTGDLMSPDEGTGGGGFTTPRYDPGSGGGGGLTKATGTDSTVYGSGLLTAAPGAGGNQLAPWYRTAGSGGGGMIGVERRPDYGHSLYTYYAAGPPAPPPLAVYAVYSDPNVPHEMYGIRGGGNIITNPMHGAPHHRGVQPLLYGGSSRVVPASGAPTAYGASPVYDTRMRYNASPYRNPAGPHKMFPEGTRMPARKYSSTGGAGPYGVNMPMSQLAAGGRTDAPGLLPPFRPPESMVVSPPLLEAAQAYGKELSYGTDSSASYGMNIERTHLRPLPSPPHSQGPWYGPDAEVGAGGPSGTYGLQGQPSPPPSSKSRFGLEAETAAAAAAGVAPEIGPYGGYNPQSPPPSKAPTTRPSYGLETEIELPYTPPYETRQLPPSAYGGGGGGGFGLNAEVEAQVTVPRPTSRSPYRSRSPVVRPVAAAPRPRVSEPGYGLEAEVGGGASGY